MDCKKQIAYESVITYIHEQIIPLHGRSTLSDFETGLRNAVLKVTNNEISGCRFHFGQANQRNVVRKMKTIPII